MALLFKSFGVAALGWLIGGAVAEEGSLRGIAWKEKRAVELEGANMEQSCSPTDLGCMAGQLACSLSTKMFTDWPVQSSPGLRSITLQLGPATSEVSLRRMVGRRIRRVRRVI